MADPYVQLPADSSGKKVRLVEVDEVADDGSALTLYQEVVTLADDDGNLLLRRGTGKKSLPVIDEDVIDRLDTLIEGIAHLIRLTEAVGHPRGPLPATDEWVDQILRR